MEDDCRSCPGLLEENRSPKILSLFSWSISDRTIRTNKTEKERFTEVVRDVYDKITERFMSRRI